MVWRSVNEAGVAFLGEYNNEMPVPLELARRLRQSEAEKGILRNRIAQPDRERRSLTHVPYVRGWRRRQSFGRSKSPCQTPLRADCASRSAAG